MSKSTNKPYNGSKRPSLQMVEVIGTLKIAEAQLSKIELRGKYLVTRHTELSEKASKSKDAKDLRSFRKEDESILAEFETLKGAKTATADRAEVLKASEDDVESYEYNTITW